ncbi:MAG: 50S ribosomal protein L4 [Thermodesulfobacteriota bacterium]|nr:50S ribosomal protein L4 [Thermodesulfobacteriota bacterium]
MPAVDVYNMTGEILKKIDLRDDIFCCEVEPYLIHDVVVWQLSNRRTGSAKTKGRVGVSGGGAKPWRQKGTGRARAGTIRSPLWRGGGVTFGPNNRKYAKKLPKKVRKVALRSTLSMKLNEGMLKIVDKIVLEETKTKVFLNALHLLGMEDALVVMGNIDRAVSVASRNVSRSKVLDVKGLNVHDIIKRKGLILDLGAIAWIEEALAK